MNGEWFDVKIVGDGDALLYCTHCSAGMFIANHNFRSIATDWEISCFMREHRRIVRSILSYQKLMLGRSYGLFAYKIPHALESQEVLAV